MYLVFIYYAYVYNVLHFRLNKSINQSKKCDLVLADRGFLIGEDLAARGATLVIPDFTRGKNS